MLLLYLHKIFKYLIHKMQHEKIPIKRYLIILLSTIICIAVLCSHLGYRISPKVLDTE